MKRTNKSRKRLWAGLLAIALLLSLVPIQLAFAAGKDTSEPTRYWQITVVKEDSGNGGIGAGDVSVAGSVYGLFSEDGELLDEYQVGPDGTFTTKRYPLGTGCWLQEIRASSGYRLSKDKYFLDEYINSEDSGEEVIHKTITAKAEVMTGTVHLASHTADPQKPFYIYNVPQVGAEFQVYLKSAGSYEAAVATGDERLYDAGITNANGDIVWENGTITSKELAYGTYILHQVSAWENRILEDDVEITFVDDGHHISYFFSNHFYSAQLCVGLQDYESGRKLINTSAAFKFLNVDTGKYFTYYDYDIDDYVDEFWAVGGNLSLPMELPYGNYQMIETRTPEGYCPNTDPVLFSVTSTNYGTLYFNTESIPLKGKLVIETMGVSGTHFIDGVTYDLVAAEDIVTGDGVVHYHEGDVVETIRTNGSVAVRSQELYIGKYLLVETGVPDGVVPAAEPVEIEATNDGEQRVFEIPVRITKEYAPAGEEDAAADIKYQIKGNSLRLVTWVDSLDYKEVVFNITVEGQTASVSSTTVYSSIYAGGVKLDNAAQVFNENARYFVTYTIEDIPEGITTFEVSVTWTDLDGNSHTSATRTVTL